MTRRKRFSKATLPYKKTTNSEKNELERLTEVDALRHKRAWRHADAARRGGTNLEIFPPSVLRTPTESEDSVYLSVWRPHSSKTLWYDINGTAGLVGAPNEVEINTDLTLMEVLARAGAANGFEVDEDAMVDFHTSDGKFIGVDVEMICQAYEQELQVAEDPDAVGPKVEVPIRICVDDYTVTDAALAALSDNPERPEERSPRSPRSPTPSSPASWSDDYCPWYPPESPDHTRRHALRALDEDALEPRGPEWTREKLCVERVPSGFVCSLLGRGRAVLAVLAPPEATVAEAMHQLAPLYAFEIAPGPDNIRVRIQGELVTKPRLKDIVRLGDQKLHWLDRVPPHRCAHYVDVKRVSFELPATPKRAEKTARIAAWVAEQSASSE